MLDALRQDRQRRDNTPIKIAASATRKPVVSRFFDEAEDDADAAAREALEEATRRSLFESFGADDDEEEDDDDGGGDDDDGGKLQEPFQPVENVEPPAEEPEPEPTPLGARTMSGRLSLKPQPTNKQTNKSAILANLLAPSRLSSQALKTLSRRRSAPANMDDDDEEQEDLEEDVTNTRPTKKLDLDKFAFKQS